MAEDDQVIAKVMEEARVHVSPEFINGLGEMINFHPLGSGHFREIVETQLEIL